MIIHVCVSINNDEFEEAQYHASCLLKMSNTAEAGYFKCYLSGFQNPGVCKGTKTSPHKQQQIPPVPACELFGPEAQ